MQCPGPDRPGALPGLPHSYNDLWRIVSLGVVAIIVIVIGSTRRLQAPFVIGAVVLLIHGVAQL
jgi:hypothetical protein